MANTIEKNPSVFLYGPGEAKIESQAMPNVEDPYDVIIRINYVGVCGSDVHWWVHGTVGGFSIKSGHPLVMGHEAAGTVQSVGPAVRTLIPGDRVALEPGYPCRRCNRCKEGHYNLCKDMMFAASPSSCHGTLCKYFKLPEDFCLKLPDHISLEEGVLLEPTSVAVHMNRLAGVKHGDSVVIFGAGTIGLLSGALAKAFGAVKIILVDVLERKLDFAKEFLEGCSTFVPKSNISPEANAAQMNADFQLGDGADVILEASGAEASVQTGICAVRKGGSFVQAGLGKSNISFPIVVLIEKELTLKGSYRYSTGDFALGLSLISDGRIPVKKLITKIVSFDQAPEAWETIRKGEGIKTLIRGVPEVRTAKL